MRSFRTRLVVLLLLLVGAIQFPTFVAVHYATRATALHQADERLGVAARVLQRLLRGRDDTLREAVRDITTDPDFRDALASNDEEAAKALLLDRGARIKAGLAVRLDRQGRIGTSTLDLPSDATRSPFADLPSRADREGMVSAVHRMGDDPYQIVMAPLRLAQRVGTVGMGFAMDRALAQDFKALTGLETTIATGNPKARTHLYSTLEVHAQADLSARLEASGLAAGASTLRLYGEDYLTRIIPLDASGGIGLVLQLPRSEVMRPHAMLDRQLLAVSLLSFLASLAGAWLLAGGVTRPIRRLADAANRIGRGDYLDTLASERRDEFGHLVRAFDGMRQGIADREMRISHLAYHDSLTDLPNRVSVERYIAQLLNDARTRHGHFAVLVVDVNRLKEVNDTLGHSTGDRLLAYIGQRIRAAARSGDMVARLGGDEFLVVLPGADQATAETLGKTISHVSAEPVPLDSMNLYPEISLGIVLFPDHADSVDDLLRRADIAMHDAKQARIAMSTYSRGRDALHLRRLSLIHDLRHANKNNELSICYQPKLTLASGRIEHVEALVRWQHPVKGPISPEEFIPLAEHAGSIGQITKWVLRNVIRQCRAWRDQGLEIGVSINISAMDLASGDLPETVRSLLVEHKVQAASVLLEVTESAVMRDAAVALEMLRRLKRCGIRLAIDDFGTGHSSLSHLKRMPVDELKIDKSFVMGMADDGDDATIVRATIELGHSMGLSVVAEGVEDPRSLRMLEDCRCDMVQGFLISRPVPAAQLTALLVSRNGLLATESPVTLPG